MAPDLLEDALGKFDEHFQNMVAEILRVGCLGRISGRSRQFGVNQTKVAGSAFSCALTKDLVAQLLGQDAATYEPDGVSELLAAHEAATGNSHDFVRLSRMTSVQQLLSTERHESILSDLKSSRARVPRT